MTTLLENRNVQIHLCQFSGRSPWVSAGNNMPLDFAGPADVDFERFDDAWIERPIAALFEQTSLRHANRIAIEDDVTRLTYRQLRQAVDWLAHHINAHVPAGQPIGIFLPHNALFPVAALACLAAGHPYVPIDMKHPAARVHDVVAEANLVAVILQPDANSTQFFSAALSQLDIAVAFNIADDAVVPLAPMATTENPAVILYTSGSTGKPKGICNDQRAILQRVAEATNSCHINPEDRCILVSSPGTIAGVREMFAALLNGAALVVTDVRECGVRGVLDTLRTGRITICYAVPALLRTLLRTPGAKQAFASLRILRVGGDITLESDLALCRSIVPASCHFFASFSSTEMPAAFQWFVPSDWKTADLRLPVGYPRPGIDFMVLDESGSPAAAGEIGELVVRSRYLALGQWQGGRLIPGPFLTDPDDPSLRILRTGDMVKLREDGLWELIGRRDRQVKIRGQRIDAAEIEAVLRGCDAVTDVAVIARRSGEEVVALVAYVVASATADAGLADTLKRVLAARLPQHSCPAELRFLDTIPQLPGFKPDIPALERLDRHVLEIRDARAQGAGAHHRRAENATDSRTGTRIRAAVEHAWTAVLDGRSFNAGMPWEQAAGDSLKAMELWFHIEEELGRSLSFDAFDARATPGDLITAIEQDLVRQEEEGGDTPVVFLMPGIAGDEPLLARFRAVFRKNIRFKVLHYPEWRQTIDAGATFPAIVDAVFAQICAEPVCGTYRLAGYSFGGFVAYEVARRIQASGHRVEFLALLDSRRWDMSQSSPLRRYLTPGVARWPLPIVGLRMILGAFVRRQRFALLRRVAHAIMSRQTAFSFTFHLHLNDKLRLSALRQWTLTPLDVPTTLFLSDEVLPGAQRDYGWGDLCNILKVVHIGGTHASMMEPPRREQLRSHFLDALGVKEISDHSLPAWR